jgi:hypothetical protein
MATTELPVEITPGSTRFDPADERFAVQADELRRDLVAGVPGAARVSTARPGTKGSVESIILALGSAGVISALVACFQHWLARDQSREITTTWTENGAEKSITVTGKNMSSAAFDHLADAMARRISE